MKLLSFALVCFFTLSAMAADRPMPGQLLHSFSSTEKLLHIVGSPQAPLIMMVVMDRQGFDPIYQLKVVNTRTGKTLHTEKLGSYPRQVSKTGDFVIIDFVNQKSALYSFAGQRFELEGSALDFDWTTTLTDPQRNEIAVFRPLSNGGSQHGYNLTILDATSFKEKLTRQFRHPHWFSSDAVKYGLDKVVFYSHEDGQPSQVSVIDVRRNEVIHTLAASSPETVGYILVDEQVALRAVHNQQGMYYSFVNFVTGVESALMPIHLTVDPEAVFPFLEVLTENGHIILKIDTRYVVAPWSMQVVRAEDFSLLSTSTDSSIVYASVELDRKCMALNEDFSQYECRRVSDDSLVFNILTQPNDGAYAHFLDYDGLKDMILDAKVISEGVVEYSFFDIYDGNMVRQFTVQNNDFTLTFAGGEQQFVVSRTGQELRSWKL